MTDANHDPALDVIVVGAGVSGLATAAGLIEAGLRVRVFEARDRVGGRLRSVQIESAGVGGPRVDLGATWFWPNEPRVNQLNQELGLAVHEQQLAGDAVFHDGTAGQRMSGNPIDVPSGRWSDGAEALTEAMASRLPAGTVVLNEPVLGIDIEEEQLVVETPKGQHTTQQVVLALPPALAVAKIEITPPLPPALVDLAKTTPVWMGAMSKVVAVYTEAFWQADGLSGAAFSHRGPMREIHDMSGPDGSPAALFGFAPAAAPGGPDREAVIAQLVDLFGLEAAQPEALYILDWRTEEWTSPADVERHTQYQTYGHAIYAQALFGGRVHWASTETSTVAPGHVEGALVAAERVVEAILNS